MRSSCASHAGHKPKNCLWPAELRPHQYESAAKPETDWLPGEGSACLCEPLKREQRSLVFVNSRCVPGPQARAFYALLESVEEVPPVVRIPVLQGRKMRLGRLWDLHKLIVVVEFMCPFFWARDDQRIVGCFWVCLWGLLLEEVSVWVSRASKAEGPPQCRWGSSHSLETERQRRGRVSLQLRRDIRLLPSYLVTLVLPVLGLLNSDSDFYPWLPGSQTSGFGWELYHQLL